MSHVRRPWRLPLRASATCAAAYVRLFGPETRAVQEVGRRVLPRVDRTSFRHLAWRHDNRASPFWLSDAFWP